jgi:hypothetical protein
LKRKEKINVNFIAGIPLSGTTLLLSMLNSVEQNMCIPEVPIESFRKALGIGYVKNPISNFKSVLFIDFCFYLTRYFYFLPIKLREIYRIKI